MKNRSDVVMSPADFLADIEVAVTDRSAALDRSPQRSMEGGNDKIDVTAGSSASRTGEHNVERKG